MKRPSLLLLILLSPVCFAASFYLEGYGALPRMWGFMLGMAALFIASPTLSALMAFRCFKSAIVRVGAFFGLQIIQVALIFCVVPPGARMEMIGIGHRLKRNLPVQILSDCSSTLTQQFSDGTLVTNSAPPQLYPPLTRASAIVAESVLPQALRGRFRCVAVSTNRGNLEVFFEYQPQIGIVCTKEQFENSFFHHRIADGVYAYHYQRP